MKYYEEIFLKDGRKCCLRNGEAQDGAAVLQAFIQTHAETDYLLTYPDECTMTAEQEGAFLREKSQRADEIEIIALVDGVVAGNAGIEAVGRHAKLRHRAEFGVCLLREYWGLGLGTALLRACVACARQAGYEQLELSVASENSRAVALYEKAGFTVYARNPRGFKARTGKYQELLSMRLEL